MDGVLCDYQDCHDDKSIRADNDSVTIEGERDDLLSCWRLRPGQDVASAAERHTMTRTDETSTIQAVIFDLDGC